MLSGAGRPATDRDGGASMTDLVHPGGFGAPAPRGALGAIFRVLDTWPKLAFAVATVAALGLAFQVGHFFEHAAQFAIWVLGDLSNICGRDTPWMSPWVTEFVRAVGVTLFPQAAAPRQMMVGMELLHLVGNSIFLLAIGCMYHAVRSKWVRWAFYIEGLHLCEHVLLTTTAIFIGKPLGVSTLFGIAPEFGREAAVGYRVTWHFVLNLLPMPLCMIALLDKWHPPREAAAA
jgi:hypothetical protein